jgi:hypothetical protein
MLIGLFLKGADVTKSFFSSLMSNPKSLLIVIALIASTYGYLKVDGEFDALHKKIAVAEQVAKVAKSQKDDAVRDTAIISAVNNANVAAIEAMKKDKIKSDKSSAELHTKLNQNSDAIKGIAAKLDSFKTNDNGPVAKVLSDTITDIQNLRDKKEKESK